MIWWLIDGGPMPTPSGGVSSTYSNERTIANADTTNISAAATGIHPALTSVAESASAQTSEQKQTLHSSTGGASGTTETSVKNTASGSESVSTSSTSQGGSHTDSSSLEESLRTVDVGHTLINAGGLTVSFTRSLFTTLKSTTVYIGSSTSAGGTPTTSTVSSSTIITSSQTLTSSYSSAFATVGTEVPQTSTTATSEVYGTTTSTYTDTISRHTEVDSELTTTSTETTLTTTELIGITITVNSTTTMTGAIPAGHLRATVIQADCGSRLFMAGMRPSPGFGAASEWWTTAGTQTTVEAAGDTTVVGGSSTASVSDEDSFSTTATEILYPGATATYTRTSAISTAEHNTVTNAAGVLLDAADGLYPVIATRAHWHIYNPPYGDAGEATLSVTGPAILTLTLNRKLLTDSSTTVLSVNESVTTTFTFERGVAIAVADCLAVAPGIAENQFGMMNVIEAACRDNDL